MKIKFKKTAFFLFCTIAAMVIVSCSSTQKIQSAFANKEVKVDASDEEWINSYHYFEKEGILLGVRNDNNYLYVAVKTDNQVAIHKIMGLGLTVWINYDGNKTKTLGIHYPLGMMNRGERQAIKEENGGPDQQKVKKKEANPQDERNNIMLKQIDLVYNGEDTHHYEVEDVKDNQKIQVALKNENDQLIYEIAIPLDNLGAKLDKSKIKDGIIGMGLETGEFKKPSGGGGMSRGGGGGMGTPGGGMQPGGGGMMPGGGGRGGRGGMRRGGGGSADENKEMQEPMDLWLQVQMGK
jgi:hypothetical protein